MIEQYESRESWRSVLISMVHLLVLPTINSPRSRLGTLCSFVFVPPLQLTIDSQSFTTVNNTSFTCRTDDYSVYDDNSTCTIFHASCFCIRFLYRNSLFLCNHVRVLLAGETRVTFPSNLTTIRRTFRMQLTEN